MRSTLQPLKGGILLILCVLLLIQLSSCSKTYKEALFKAPTDINADTIKSLYVVNSLDENTGSYRIKPFDMLSIREISSISNIAPDADKATAAALAPIIYKVDENGFIGMPALGNVQIGGLTRQQAREKIEGLYKADCQGCPGIRNAVIEISIINLKVTMLGEFVKQGNFMLEKENTSLIEVIGEAGGITPRANPKKLKIIRGNQANPEIIYVNLTDINTLASNRLTLRNNDIIYLEPQPVFTKGDKLQSVANIAQPIFLFINTALILYNLTK